MQTAQSGLVGRDREIGEVEAMLTAAAGGAGRVVVVSAGAGTGKSALLDTALDRARREGFTVLSARGISSERELPFGLVSRLFEPVAAELAQAGPPFTGLGHEAPHPPAGCLPDHALSVELHAFHRALARLSTRAPVLVAVDDLQYLDRESLRWLSALPQRVDHARIAVMLTVCPGEPCADPAVLDELLSVSAVELHPAALSAPATSTVIERALDAAPDAPFVAAVMREAGGNPLSVTELTSVLRDRAVTPTSDSAGVLDDIAVPRLAARLRARLRRISPHALDIARATAVLGAEADLARVARLCGLAPEAVMAVATALGRAGLMEPAGESLAFAQPLTRSTLLRDVPLADLHALHTRAAGILRATGAPGDRAAEQLMAASAPGEGWAAQPWAADVLREAAATALGRGEPERAGAYLARALREPLPAATRTTLLAELGHAEGFVDLGAAIGHLTAATRDQRVRDGSPRAERGVRSEHGRADDVLPDDVRAVPAGQPPEHALPERALRELAEHLTATGRPDEARHLLSERPESIPGARALWLAELRCDTEAENAGGPLPRLRRPARPDGVDEGRYLGLLATRTARAGRSRSRAVAFAEQALAVLPVTPEALPPTLRAVQVLAQAGRAEDAIERCDELAGQAARWGHRPGLAAVRSLRGLVAHRLGRMPAAAEDAAAALELLVGCRAPRHSGATVELLARLVEIHVELGGYDEAAALIVQAEPRPEAWRTWGGTALLLARGRLRVAAGQPADGLRDLLAAGGRLPAWKVDNPAVAPWRSGAARALLALGEPAEARRYAADEVEQARRWGTPGPLAAALRAMGAVAGGAEGLAVLEKSVSVAERSDGRLDLARSLAEHGAALNRAKRREPARRALRAALDLAEECGCADLAGRARIELYASGGRPPRSTDTAGVAALTAAELRTATLAAEGRTNRELAEILLVGLRTVEVHLTHAYRKLGIEGREHLPAVLLGRADPRVESRADSR
ncbi:regulatory protein, luxR family [Actinacidiphila yanglinensis]|uniref:Regulatory protein, luxR family n=1 Tax=Actinacidiphila yanglinensis TaxID=310779 RepID=A0A1H6DDV3_9ACTN|nr:LuxR family transcriptional regulator [Actinacidiphila yanglinensis]SEG83449.1 regulatory protein, luxR family [Actinacidiphila yanglinensis]